MGAFFSIDINIYALQNEHETAYRFNTGRR